MEIKKDIFEKTSFIILIFYFIGFLVHNIFLTRFGVSQLDLFRGRYFLSGISLFVIITSIFVYLMLFLDHKNISNNFNIDIFLEWLGRLTILPFVIGYLVGSPKVYNNTDFPSTFFFKLVYILVNSILLFIFLRFMPNRSEHDKYMDRIFQKITKICSLPILFILALLSIHYVILRQISIFVFFQGILVWVYLFTQRDAEEGFYIELPTTIYQSFAIIAISFILSFVSLISLYTRTLYDLMPQSLGGGCKTPAFIYFNEDSVDVFVIDESQDWFIIEENNKVIYKIRTDEIRKIEYKIKK